MSAATFVRLKITLDDVIPADPAPGLGAVRHQARPAAADYPDRHLYEIRAGDVGFSTPDPRCGLGRRLL